MAREKKLRYAHVSDDPVVQEAARRVIDAAPPATPEQIARVRMLFRVASDTPPREDG